MEMHSRGQGRDRGKTQPSGDRERGLEGNQERTQPPGGRGRDHGGRGDFAAFTYYIHQQEQTPPDLRQAPFGGSHAGFPSDASSVLPTSGSNAAESSRHFPNYASLLETSPDPDLQALLDPPSQAHPESSRAGLSSNRILDGLMRTYSSLQRYEKYLKQDTYDHAHPPEAFLRLFSSLIKAKKQ